MLTGGEPLLPKNRDLILKLLKKYPDKEFDIETNGTIQVDDEIMKVNNVNFVISPKFNVEQIKEVEGATIPILLNQLLDRNIDGYIVKFLFDNKDDLIEILRMKELLNLDNKKIWVQPVGTDKDVLMEKIRNNYVFIVQNRFNISFRLHCWLFGNRKGV